MKRLVICCDGTWQSLDNGWPTNVQRMAQFVLPTSDHGVPQIVYYDAGIGTGGFLDKLSGGAFGHGLDTDIRQAYSFLSLNYEPGDEIYLFGFSRGAYTVRSLAGLIYSCGIVRRANIRAIPRAIELYRDRVVHPDHDESISFRRSHSIGDPLEREEIYFLGCWDTVGALGVPDAIPFMPIDDLLGEKYEFHDIKIGNHIRHARHAVAIDERRRVFDVTRMVPLKNMKEGSTFSEMWFPGDHGAVGGGSRDSRGLADGAMLWMLKQAEAQGLAFNAEEVSFHNKPDALSDYKSSVNFRHTITVQKTNRQGPSEISSVSEDARKRWKEYDTDQGSYRPKTLRHLSDSL